MLLQKKSIRFNNFHVSPVCAPTRSSLMTGRYSLRTGVRDTYNGGAIMVASEFTLAEMLKKVNYSTGIFGKWHLETIILHVQVIKDLTSHSSISLGELDRSEILPTTLKWKQVILIQCCGTTINKELIRRLLFQIFLLKTPSIL